MDVQVTAEVLWYVTIMEYGSLKGSPPMADRIVFLSSLACTLGLVLSMAGFTRSYQVIN